MRLTIAIPTVNRAYCLRRAVESALAQDTSDIEVLVSDNASDDSTPKLLAILEKERCDPRLRVLHQATRLPITAHGNLLVSEASGDLFLGLSDDDWIEPTLASRAIAVFKAHSDLSFVYTGCKMHLGCVELCSPTGPATEDPIQFLEEYLAGRRQVYWCGCVTRTTDLRRLGPLPPDRLIGDMYYWTRLAMEGPIGCVPEPLAHYTFVSDNMSIGIPASAWAKETALLVHDILEGVQRLELDRRRVARIAREGRRYVARSTANQVVLNAQRGMSKVTVAREVATCVKYLAGDPTGFLRTAGALFLPPSVLRRLTEAFAKRLADRLQRQVTGKAWHEVSGPLWRSRPNSLK